MFRVHSVIRIFSFSLQAEDSPGPASYNINNFKVGKQIAKEKKPVCSFGKRIEENIGKLKRAHHVYNLTKI